MKTSDELFARLQALGAGEFEHLNGSLAAHLRGTERMLREWGGSEPLCTAGLYHAVYGTDGYDPALAPLAERGVIAKLIGAEAEALAYLYGACNRTVFYPRVGTAAQLVFADRFSNGEYDLRAGQLSQLCELIVANELELASNNAGFRTKHAAAMSRLFDRMSGLISPGCAQAYRRMLR